MSISVSEGGRQAYRDRFDVLIAIIRDNVFLWDVRKSYKNAE